MKGTGHMPNAFLSRRFFIGGLAAFGAQAMFGAQTLRPGAGLGRPRLRFGVITDVHLAFNGKQLLTEWNTDIVKRTFAWLRDREVDAVLCGGDIADRCQIDEMRAFADAWFAVFPDDRLPNGRHVERVFVTGNHDSHGHRIYRGMPKIYPDPEELKRHIFIDRREQVWKELFHEDYRSIFRKEVKGYSFIGSMWEDGASGKEGYRNFGRIAPFMEREGRKLDPKLPFFYIQHPHPKDTCYGPWAWGHDGGEVTACLSKYPNAVAFSGHSHYPLTDERSIWQGGFTSIGAASLRYCGHPKDEFAPHGFGNGRLPIDHSSAQGLLVSVYDDRIVYARRDFTSDLAIGEDWVQPLPVAESRPFAFTEHARRFGAPEFVAGAKLVTKETTLRDAKGGEKATLEVTIPPVVPKPDARVRHFSVSVVAKDGKRKDLRILATGYNQSEASKRAVAETRFNLPLEELPGAEWTLTVCPVSCFGKKGKSLQMPLDF